MISKPMKNEYAEYFERYVSLVHDADVLGALDRQVMELKKLVGAVSMDRETFRYAPGKWSIREVIGHLGDAERVFGYRSFCISRGETAPLPSFDENGYVAASRYNEQGLAELVAEFAMVRQSNLAFLRQVPDATWTQMGTASGKPISLRAIPFIMLGHVRHHFNGLRVSYEVAVDA